MAPASAIAVLLAIVAAAPLTSQENYTGPPPPRKNTPYIVHADNLIETEATTARQETKKDQTTYTIPGEKSPARTPLASPLLVVETDGLDAEKLKLFRLEPANGHREVTFHNNGKGGAISLTTEITKVAGNLYQIRVVDSLGRGEYALTPDGTNDVFCFEVF